MLKLFQGREKGTGICRTRSPPNSSFRGRDRQYLFGWRGAFAPGCPLTKILPSTTAVPWLASISHSLLIGFLPMTTNLDF